MFHTESGAEAARAPALPPPPPRGRGAGAAPPAPHHVPHRVGVGAGQRLDTLHPAADQDGRVRGADASECREARRVVRRARVARAQVGAVGELRHRALRDPEHGFPPSSAQSRDQDRKSTRLNSSHGYISYAVFCLKKKNPQRRAATKPSPASIRFPAPDAPRRRLDHRESASPPSSFIVPASRTTP